MIGVISGWEMFFGYDLKVMANQEMEYREKLYKNGEYWYSLIGFKDCEDLISRLLNRVSIF